MQEKRLPINPSWYANQLLCAATAFAVMLMGRDDYLDAVLSSSTPNIATSESTPSSVHLIQEQLDWLSTWIFDILDCLQIVHASTGSRSAMLCLHMLEGMCRIDKQLQDSYQRRYGGSSIGDRATTSTRQGNEAQDVIDLVWASNEEAIIASEILNFQHHSTL